MLIAEIILNLPINSTFFYLVPDYSIEGNLALVPFGRSKALGVIKKIIDDDNHIDISKMKASIEVFDNVKIDLRVIDFAYFCASYTINYIGSIIKLVIPFKDFEYPSTKVRPIDQVFHQKNLNLSTLTDIQSESLKAVESFEAQKKPIVLHGKTGSGKTEVYLHKIANILAADSSAQVLVMFPEIGLTGSVVQKFIDTFGFKPFVWNSSVTEAKKKQAYIKIQDGSIKLVIGTRSAMFLPYKNLKLIVIDEEHDQSYKQEDTVIYNARDMAVARARFFDFNVLLVSATPSIETEQNCIANKYNKVVIDQRFNDINMPDIDLIDLKKSKLKNGSCISDASLLEARKALEKGKQVLFFLNKRGYVPILKCSDCGYSVKCRFCDVFLVKHKWSNRLICHKCSFTTSIVTNCPSCDKNSTLKEIGFGAEKAHEELSNIFLDKRFLLLTSDTVSTPKKMDEAINKIKQNEVDIIIGTQIISKGFHFKDLDLVCVLDGDFGMGLVEIDFRAYERTYQLLTQVAGRAGRESGLGKVIIQTYNVNSTVLNAIKNNDEEGFYKFEIQERMQNNIPPFSRYVSIMLTSKDQKLCNSYAKEMVSTLRNIFQSKGFNIQLFGPIPSLIKYIKLSYRYRILIKADKNVKVQDILSLFIKSFKKESKVSVRYDVDPYTFL